MGHECRFLLRFFAEFSRGLLPLDCKPLHSFIQAFVLVLCDLASVSLTLADLSFLVLERFTRGEQVLQNVFVSDTERYDLW